MKNRIIRFLMNTLVFGMGLLVGYQSSNLLLNLVGWILGYIMMWSIFEIIERWYKRK
jgi:hypothetical protein